MDTNEITPREVELDAFMESWIAGREWQPYVVPHYEGKHTSPHIREGFKPKRNDWLALNYLRAAVKAFYIDRDVCKGLLKLDLAIRYMSLDAAFSTPADGKGYYSSRLSACWYKIHAAHYGMEAPVWGEGIN